MANQQLQNFPDPLAGAGLGMRGLRLLLMGAMLIGSGSLAGAQTTASPPDPLFNPQPLADDLELPVPCGGKMVFRHVHVLGKGLFDDYGFNLGYAYSADEPGYRQAFFAGYRNGFVTGQFLLEDLPLLWRDLLTKSLNRTATAPTKGGLQPVLYSIGKYEVTDWQYRLVMAQAETVAATPAVADVCPPAESGAINQRLPKVNLSWFDALRFTEIYSHWLARHARERLPAVVAGVRKKAVRWLSSACPAKRNGSLPPVAGWWWIDGLEGRLFPRPLAGGGDGPLGDWAVYQAVVGGSGFTARLMPIGAKRPNPLGLHDTIGNATEMILEPFHMVRGSGRTHGAAGGFVVKGGNYTKGEDALFTGMRREYPFFHENGTPRRNETTGFRVVVASITAPKARLTSLFDQWQQDGRMSNLVDLEKIQGPRPNGWMQ